MKAQVEQLAYDVDTVYALGALKRTYKSSPTFFTLVRFVLVRLSLIVLVCTLVAMALLLIRPSPNNGLLIVIPGLVIICSILLTGYLKMKAMVSGPHLKTFLYEKGLVWIEYDGERIDKCEVVGWQDIAIIWHDVMATASSPSRSAVRNVGHSYRLECHDGSQVSYPVEDSELGRFIERETLPRLLSAARKDFYNEESPVFGPFWLPIREIRYRGKSLPWLQFERATISNSGMIAIYKRGERQPWQTISCNGVPNPAVLVALLNSIRREMS